MFQKKRIIFVTVKKREMEKEKPRACISRR
nr:MAG TPA: hypothetical protein [Caudoviricetes sp.]